MDYSKVTSYYILKDAAKKAVAEGYASFYQYMKDNGLLCDHTERLPGKITQANGVERVALVCEECGDRYYTGVRKSDYNLAKLKDAERYFSFNDTVAECSKLVWDSFQAKKAGEQAAQSAEWWAAYTEYLKTDKWRLKSRKVLERDGHLCQACLTRQATQAHHLTYARVFNEPLFDLVAVCKPCHEKLHNRSFT